MSIQELLPVILAPVFAVSMLILYIQRHKEHHELIHREIKKHGGKPIKISFQWFESDRWRAQSYEVVFANQPGQKFRVRCKIDYQNRLYWDMSPARILTGGSTLQRN